MKTAKLFAAFFLSLCLLHAQEATAVSPANDIARFLAGMPPQSDPELIQFSRDPVWQRHAATFADWWNYRTQPQIQKATVWAHEELGNASAGPLFYFFSGPDFLYAQALFPNASTYVLCAKEPAGRIPALSSIPPQQLPAALSNLQRSVQSLMNFSYFITEDMKKDLNSTPLSGITPVLYVLMARTGKTIVNAQPVSLSSDGRLGAGNPANPQGMRIDFTSGGGAIQTLYYFSCDLSNSGLKANSGVLKFCSRVGMGNGFLKSASYLPHLPEFSHACDFLLSNCGMIVQDDSGIPLRDFAPDKWNLRFFGRYVGPIRIFAQYYQKDLADRYGVSNPKPMDFGMGYRFQARETAIMVAFRKSKAE